jgi:FecR protein
MKLNKLALALTLGVGQGLWLSAWAAGNVDQVRGEASVLNRDGQPRGAAKGERVVEGETIVTGADGEVLLTTDDSGVLAVRPRSRVQIEAYKVNGNENDSVVLKLLRGSLRSITGWITKTAPRNYRVATPTATVGIRGTDHETSVVEEGIEPGTYNQVTSGETSFSTAAGSINIGPGQAGHAPQGDQPPKPLPAPPPNIFPPRDSDARVAELKTDAEGQRDERLKTKQEQVRRSGGVSQQGNPRVSAQCAPGSPASQTLDALLRAYERGDAAFLQRRLDPAMVGYGTVINDVMRDNAAQRQTQVRVLDMQMQCGPDVAVIDFAWEKRFLSLPGFTPQVVRGRSSVLISQLGGGVSGQWAVSGLVGDPVFQPPRAVASAPDLGKAAVLSATSFVNYAAQAQVSVPVTVSVNPPNPQPTATVGITAAQGLTCSVSSFSFSCNATYSGTAIFTTPLTAVAPSDCVVSGVPFTGGTATMNYSAKSVTQNFVGAAGTTGAVIVPINLEGTGTLVTASGTFTLSKFIGEFCKPDVTFAPNRANLAVVIEVQDADVTAGSVQVQIQASNGDAQLLTLPQVAPGTFRLSSLPVIVGAPVGTDPASIELPSAGSGPVTLTLTYTDASPGVAGGPARRQTTMQLDPGLNPNLGARRRP